jgi:hypothetical protein
MKDIKAAIIGTRAAAHLLQAANDLIRPARG